MAHGVAALNFWRHGAGVPCVGPSTLSITSPADGSHVCQGGNLDFTWGVDACSDEVTVDWAGHFIETISGGSGSIDGLIESPGSYTLSLTATHGTNPSASITITVDAIGCMDPGACNYNPAAACDDGSCCYVTGCTDSSATNYDPSACCDDGSCTYINGCTTAGACNYDPTATRDDGSCTFPGCTDPGASNYDPSAGCDDGSCTY